MQEPIVPVPRITPHRSIRGRTVLKAIEEDREAPIKEWTT